jgi:hypothetical protein
MRPKGYTSQECYRNARKALWSARRFIADAYYAGPNSRKLRAWELMDAVSWLVLAAEWREQARELRRRAHGDAR